MQLVYQIHLTTYLLTTTNYEQYYRNYDKLFPHMRTDWTAYFNLIQHFQKLGYVNQFRPGTQMDSLIISRSKSYGMRRDQPRIQFFIKPKHYLLACYRHGDEYMEIEVPSDYITDELDELLQELLSHPVD